MRFVWDFVLGPVLALLPRPWRQKLIEAREPEWRRAGTASGIYESIGAVVGIGYWYMSAMGRFVNAAIAAAASGKMGEGVTEHQIGGAALALWAMHPLTWLLFYLFFEGGVRMASAAFGEKTVGSLPLVMVERVAFWTIHRKEARVGEIVREHADSFASAIRERAMAATRKELPDELKSQGSGAEEVLVIRASRRKEEWVAPRVVRMGEAYYRLEDSWKVNGERPFCYRLKRLEAGVPGRSVIVYEAVKKVTGE